MNQDAKTKRQLFEIQNSLGEALESGSHFIKQCETHGFDGIYIEYFWFEQKFFSGGGRRNARLENADQLSQLKAELFSCSMTDDYKFHSLLESQFPECDPMVALSAVNGILWDKCTQLYYIHVLQDLENTITEYIEKNPPHIGYFTVDLSFEWRGIAYAFRAFYDGWRYVPFEIKNDKRLLSCSFETLVKNLHDFLLDKRDEDPNFVLDYIWDCVLLIIDRSAIRALSIKK